MTEFTNLHLDTSLAKWLQRERERDNSKLGCKYGLLNLANLNIINLNKHLSSGDIH